MAKILSETEKLVCETCKGTFDNLEKIKIEYNMHEMTKEQQIEYTNKINEYFDKYDVSKKDRWIIVGLIMKLNLSLLTEK